MFFLKNSLRDRIQRALTGFAAGVMVAASVWSLSLIHISITQITFYAADGVYVRPVNVAL